jgi:hypothetical protein
METVMKEREMKEIVKKKPARNSSFPLLLLIILACASCGQNIIQGRPPFISISELSLQGDQLTVDFNISNPNGEAMNIDGIEITVRVEEAELTRYNEDFKLAIGANSTEVIEVEQFPDAFVQDLLVSLKDGEVPSLPFRLEGGVHTTEDGLLKFRHKGHLYPVPGKPGYFRSATIQSSRIRQDDPFKEIDDDH